MRPRVPPLRPDDRVGHAATFRFSEVGFESMKMGVLLFGRQNGLTFTGTTRRRFRRFPLAARCSMLSGSLRYSRAAGVRL